MTGTAVTSSPARARIEVRGIVQGVGFRPFVYRLAQELELDGWVRNDGNGVTIEAEGEGERIAAFARRIRDEAPPLARVDTVQLREAAPGFEYGFAILESGAGRTSTAIGPDSAICADCLAELFDRNDRRYRYPFINCTNCGPRYTITRGLPYDRAMTSMAGFVQCPSCSHEYRAPEDRRFHAEPNACPLCGPRVTLLDACGNALEGDAIAATLARLQRGEIVAIKGLGGFHLACDARNANAVARLRQRKAREEKPFAVMAANVESLQDLATIAAAESAMLQSAERPIVLLRKQPRTDVLLAGIAPGLAWLGAMLPYTPLHYLLFHEAAGRPTGTQWLLQTRAFLLVMTSANPGGEPLVTANGEALRRLAGIADAFLVYDRDIVTRCDDSVVRTVQDHAPPSFQFIRRARGYTPRAIKLAHAGPSVLAVGGYFKNTVCVTRGDEAFVSQHIGDLDNAPTCIALEDATAHLLAILEVEPQVVAHDLHPDFLSTRHAAALAARLGVPLHGVQHHHAHVAAVVAEHRVTGPVLGLALDGVGLGDDGAAWGGELLRVEGDGFARLGRFVPLRLPGGDVAAREPWRMAAAALHRCGRDAEIARRFSNEVGATTIAALLARGTQAPETSSAGRHFDAAAGLLGIRRRSAFEGQAAMLLEGLAEEHGPVAHDPHGFRINASRELDLAPLLVRLADTRDSGFGAALFHSTLVAALADWIADAALLESLSTVACSGGCFLNAILARDLRSALTARGISMLEARALPPNDGGLALGQAWIARQAAARGLAP